MAKYDIGAVLESIYKHVDKKELARVNWAVLKPALEKAAADTANTQVDDAVVKAVSLLVERFLLN